VRGKIRTDYGNFAKKRLFFRRLKNFKRRQKMAEENLLTSGISLYNKGEYSASLAYFLSLPDDSGADDLEMAYYIGLCYLRLKRYDDALLYLEQVVTSAHDDDSGENSEKYFQCRYLLAVIYSVTGRKKLCEFELNKLLDAGYRTSSVYASLAFLAWEEGKADISLSYYKRSLAEDESNSTALNGMGYVLACQGEDLAKALSCCKKALDISPESAACLDSLGWVYFKMGLFSEAKKYLERAVKIDSSNPIIIEHLQEVQNAQS
jgi:tetratricopeptide (TPR) repeat protein